MTFLNPWGLLGLIGIPVLILVYILKNKFTEQVIPTTYLWTLSEKFLKRKNPLSKLSGIISLVLQLLLVAVISLSIAHPIIVLPGQAHDYCFILDGSGSMTMSRGESTRFEVGKDRIAEIIEGATKGSSYTLIYSADTSSLVYEKLTDKEEAILLLERVQAEHSTTEITDAIGIAQGYFNSNPAMLTYLVSDTHYQVGQGITQINPASSESNLSIENARYTISSGKISLFGEIMSYGKEGAVTISLTIYPTLASTTEQREPATSIEVTLIDGERVPFEIRVEESEFYSLKLQIEAEDSLALDNEVILYNVDSANSYRALLVSTNPFFIKSAITSVGGHIFVDAIAPSSYKEQTGYDLYIFDGFTPSAMPKSGAVWFFNPTDSLSGSGFSVQDAYAPEDAMELSLSGSSATTVKNLLSGLNGKDIFVTEFMKCSLYNNFYTLLEYKGNPVVFTGTNDYGNREVVFAFDLQESNFPMLFDFVALTRNLVEFSFPTVLEKTDYTTGDTLTVNVISGCESIVVESPLGNSIYLDTTSATAEHVLTEAGVYKVTLTTAGNERDYYIFSSFPEAERNPYTEGREIELVGQTEEGGIDGMFDDLTILFIALALLFSMDWMVYCYEKYQLR